MTTTSSVSSTSSSSTLPTSTTTAANGQTTTTSPGSAILTALGAGTGIDMTNLATEISTASFADRTASLTNQLSAVAVQISEASTLQSNMSSLVSSFASLVNGGSLSSTPTVTNSGVATASLPPGTNGAGMGYSLEVDALAQAQVLASPALSSATSTTGSGTLTIQFGKISGTSFTADSSKTGVNVTINQGDSLTQIAQDINASGAGITAYVANTAHGAQLVMKGPTGADNAFTVSASENSADPGLSALAWNPAATGAASRLAEPAQDASFKIDGIAQTSASNTIANAAPSLTLSLTGTNAGNPTTITYSDPSSNISTAMTNLTSALNQIVSTLNTDMTPSANGSLTNDQGAQALQRTLAGLTGSNIMPHAASGAPSTLADLGLVVGKDGTYTLNQTTLSNAIAKNPAGVAAMFTNGLYGVYGTLSNIGFQVASASDPGSLAGSVTYYTGQQTTLQTQQTAVATQQSDMRTRLISQLAASNTAVAQSNSTLAFLKQQIAAWNGTSSSSG